MSDLTTALMETTKPKHPLHQIAETPTHKLLLKQWLKEEELILGRIGLKETQIDSTRKEITHLCTFFFLFHSTSLLLLFNISNSTSPQINAACKRSWIPSLCSLICSLGIIWAIRYKTDVEAHMEKLLEREKEDGKLLGKCVDELKRKGLEFDLLKEVDALRRAKSMRVEAKAVRKWSARDFVTFFFFAVACIVIALTRVILCVCNTASGYELSLPGCPRKCGNMSVPYPFGTQEGCYLNDHFFINCTTCHLWIIRIVKSIIWRVAILDQFITNGTLFDHIQKDYILQMPWKTLLRITTEIAGALSYLHSAAAIPIIHRDVKTTNILLDAGYIAKVSDFGTSKFAHIDKTSLTTLVQGTLGYLDPEWFLWSC
ncbi:hypothetical protein V2J09_023506 [Rumex salicifolius]